MMRLELVETGIVHACQHFGCRFFSLIALDLYLPGFLTAGKQFITEGFELNVQFFIAPGNLNAFVAAVYPVVFYEGITQSNTTPIGFIDRQGAFHG